MKCLLINSILFVVSITANQRISEMRLLPASLKQDKEVLMEDVDVTYDAESNEYTISLTPFDCASNLDLLQLLNSEKVGNS